MVNASSFSVRAACRPGGRRPRVVVHTCLQFAQTPQLPDVGGASGWGGPQSVLADGVWAGSLACSGAGDESRLGLPAWRTTVH